MATKKTTKKLSIPTLDTNDVLTELQIKNHGEQYVKTSRILDDFCEMFFEAMDNNDEINFILKNIINWGETRRNILHKGRICKGETKFMRLSYKLSEDFIAEFTFEWGFDGVMISIETSEHVTISAKLEVDLNYMCILYLMIEHKLNDRYGNKTS